MDIENIFKFVVIIFIFYFLFKINSEKFTSTPTVISEEMKKTINTILNIKDETNILTLINTIDLSITNINIKNNYNCLLNNS